MTPPLYFAEQNTGEEFKNPLFICVTSLMFCLAKNIREKAYSPSIALFIEWDGSCSSFSPTVSRSITGCGVSHIREVSRSDGGVERLYGVRGINGQSPLIIDRAVLVSPLFYKSRWEKGFVQAGFVKCFSWKKRNLFSSLIYYSMENCITEKGCCSSCQWKIYHNKNFLENYLVYNINRFIFVL